MVKYDWIIVGSGFSGATCARELAEKGYKVLVCEKEHYVGGTSADFVNELGQIQPRFGPHAWHTNSVKIKEYAEKFAEWMPYEQRSVTRYNGSLWPIPINQETIDRFFKGSIENINELQRKIDIKSSYDLAISIMGKELYEAFYKGYTEKQWGMPAEKLDRVVIGRLPVYSSYEDRYFKDEYQMIPVKGFTHFLSQVLTHPNIEVEVCMYIHDYLHANEFADNVIWTGPVDQAGLGLGELPWRSLYWKEIISEFPNVYACVHEASAEVPFTRTMDCGYFYPSPNGKTKWLVEYPCGLDNPQNTGKLYPVHLVDNPLEEQYRHKMVAMRSENVFFLGRPGTFRYQNMDQSMAHAIKFCEGIAPK